MTRFFAALRPATLLAVIPFTACSNPPPPYAPTALAIPRVGQSASQFQADDFACRTYMAEANRSAARNGAVEDQAVAGGTQWPSDVSYGRCMMSKGYSVETVNWLNNVVSPPRYGSSAGGYSSAGASGGGYSSSGGYSSRGGY